MATDRLQNPGVFRGKAGEDALKRVKKAAQKEESLYFDCPRTKCRLTTVACKSQSGVGPYPCTECKGWKSLNLTPLNAAESAAYLLEVQLSLTPASVIAAKPKPFKRPYENNVKS